MFWFFYFFVHILFSTISAVDANKRDANTKFANLLKDIVSINERRFEAMKELARLQEYSVSKYQLRSGRDYFDDQENSRRVLVVFISEGRNPRTNLNKRVYSSYPVWINEDLEPHRTKMTRKSDFSDEKDSIESIEGLLELTRRTWNTGCKKKMDKFCRKACVRAYKNVCRTFSCEKRIKRKFRLECKSTCNAIFNKGKYSEEE